MLSIKTFLFSKQIPSKIISLCELILVCWGIAYSFAFVDISTFRMSYELDFDWMEQQVLQSVIRASQGLRIFQASQLDYTPTIYPPVYYYVTAFVSKFSEIDFPTARLVSWCAVLGTIILSFSTARKISGSLVAGFLTVSFYLAAYHFCGLTYESARVDSLALFLVLLTFIFSLKLDRFYLIAIFYTLALTTLFTKQTTLLPIAALLLAILIEDVKKGMIIGLLLTLIGGLLVFLCNLNSNGWLLFYTFTVPQSHKITNLEAFFHEVSDILWPGLILQFAAIAGSISLYVIKKDSENRDKMYLAFFSLGLIMMSVVPRIKEGGNFNNYSAMILAISLWIGILFSSLRKKSLAPACLIVLFVFLFAYKLSYNYIQIKSEIPSNLNNSKKVSIYQNLQAPIYAPQDPLVSSFSGNNQSAHWGVTYDIYNLPDLEQQTFSNKLNDAISHTRFNTIILSSYLWHRELIPFNLINKYYCQISPEQLYAKGINGNDYLVYSKRNLGQQSDSDQMCL